jgi:hypothetical protein
MAVYVSFVKPKNIGPVITGNLSGMPAPAVGSCRVFEKLTLGDPTTAAARSGEIALVYNGEATAIQIAFGPTPDASLNAESGVSTAAIVVPAGQSSDVLVLKAGDKVDTAALS